MYIFAENDSLLLMSYQNISNSGNVVQKEFKWEMSCCIIMLGEILVRILGTIWCLNDNYYYQPSEIKVCLNYCAKKMK